MKYKVLPQNAPKLVLNLGHSPLYRHFCECLHIEMLTLDKVFTHHTSKV